MRRFFGWVPGQHDLLPDLQNLRMEVEHLESMLAVSRLPESAELEACRTRLRSLQDALDDRFSWLNSLYMWLTIFWIQERLILIRPRDELIAVCQTLQSRLYRIPKTERGEWDKSLAQVIKVIEEKKDVDAQTRNELMVIRKMLDDRYILSIWHASMVSRALAILLLMLVVVLAIFTIRLSCLDTSQDTALNVWNCLLAGMTGAILSVIMNFFAGSSAKGLPQTRVPIIVCRPFIGAAAGVVFYLMAKSGAITFTNDPAGYLVAFAFGFSEQLFVKTLKSLAAQAESQTSSAFGVGEEDPGNPNETPNDDDNTSRENKSRTSGNQAQVPKAEKTKKTPNRKKRQ